MPTTDRKPYELAEDTGDPDEGALRVIVLDENEASVAGVRVLLCDYRTGRLAPWRKREIGADGRVEIRDLMPGPQLLAATAQDHGRMLKVDLVAGRMTETTVTFQRWKNVIEGLVTRAGRVPLAEATVRLMPLKDKGSDFYATPSDQQGRYRLASVAPGTYLVMVTHTSLGSSPRRARDLKVPAEGVVENDIAVDLPGIEGVVTDVRSGQPISGVTIELFEPPYETVTTGADGAFRFFDVPSGSFKGVARREGYQERSFEGARSEERRTDRLRIALEPAALVRVRLLDEQGQPLTGPFSLDSRRTAPPGDPASARVPFRADADGGAVVNRLAEGAYSLRVTGQGMESDWKRVTVGGDTGRIGFTLVASPETPRADAAPDIIGTVTDNTTRRPVAHVGVAVATDNFLGGVLAYTDAGGRFTLRGLQPGRFALQLSKDGYGFRLIRDVEVSAGKPTRVQVRQQPAATLRLRVTDAEGTPVPGEIFLAVKSVARGKGTDAATPITAHAQGVAVWRQIVPGTYILLVKVEGRGKARVQAEIRSGENLVDVRLASKGRG